MNMDAEEQRQDNEKNRLVNKLVDLCLSLTEEVMHLKDLIESSTMERRRTATMPSAPQYSYTTALVEPYIREIRQRQQQEEEQRTKVEMFDEESNSSCEDMIDCDDVDLPPLKRRKLQ